MYWFPNCKCISHKKHKIIQCVKGNRLKYYNIQRHGGITTKLTKRKLVASSKLTNRDGSELNSILATDVQPYNYHTIDKPGLKSTTKQWKKECGEMSHPSTYFIHLYGFHFQKVKESVKHGGGSAMLWATITGQPQYNYIVCRLLSYNSQVIWCTIP